MCVVPIATRGNPGPARAAGLRREQPCADGAAARAAATASRPIERHERGPLFVRKRGGERQPFDRIKLRGGLARAAHKRPVAPESIDAIVDRIEHEAEGAGGELPASRVGELCLAGLRDLDRVAYLQFAAVYKQLDVEAVRSELSASPGDRTAPESSLGFGPGICGFDRPVLSGPRAILLSYPAKLIQRREESRRAPPARTNTRQAWRSSGASPARACTPSTRSSGRSATR